MHFFHSMLVIVLFPRPFAVIQTHFDGSQVFQMEPIANSYLKVEAGGRPRHQVVEVLVEILAEDILRHGLVGVKRLLL